MTSRLRSALGAAARFARDFASALPLPLAVALLSLVPLARAQAPIPASETSALAEAFKLPPRGLASDMKTLDDHIAELERRAADTEGLAVRVGTVSAWSIGQHTMHIARVINYIAGQMGGLLDNPTKDADAEKKPIAGAVLGKGEIPRGVGKAPAPVAIHFAPTPEQVKDEVAQAKAIWKKIAARKSDIETSQATFPHFAFGPLTATDWVRFIAIHDAHHLKIMADIDAAKAKAAK